MTPPTLPPGARRGPNERGLVSVLIIFMLSFILVLSGIAIDFNHFSAVRNELTRSMDSAALAGAGALGFNDTTFPTVRSNAQQYAGWNPYSEGNISLSANSGNGAGGDIVLGIWNGLSRTFTPSTDGTLVNAVRCRVTRPFTTSFLSFLGLTSLNVSADSIAVSAPPSTIPPTGCLFPMGLTECAFSAGGSSGCGQIVSTMTPTTTNTATWLNTTGPGTPGTNDTRAAIEAAATGTCAGSTLQAGTTVGTNGGMGGMYNQAGPYPGLGQCNSSGAACHGIFYDKYNETATYTVNDAAGNLTYSGHGWEVFAAVVSTGGCPAGQINGDRQITSWSRLVITQVINGGYCVVANHTAGNPWDAVCPGPNGTAPDASRDPSLNAVFGYYDCTTFEATSPSTIPGPRSALAARMRLVQ